MENKVRYLSRINEVNKQKIVNLLKYKFMTSGIIDNKIEQKDLFNKKIKKYFLELSNNKIPSDLLNELVDKITDTQYINYKRFWNQYPKSRKRYSEFKIEDLENSFTQYEITDFLKLKDSENYRKYSMLLIKMAEKEFYDFEMKRYQYETK